MYTFCIVMIAIASILLILAVLVQSPKSGMAANFGAANQTIGVRQTTDILEKFTWAMIVVIVVFSLLSTTAAPKKESEKENKSTAGQILGEKAETAPAVINDNVLDISAPIEQIAGEEVAPTATETTDQAE